MKNCVIIALKFVELYAKILVIKYKTVEAFRMSCYVTQTEGGGALENLVRVPKVQSDAVRRPISQAKGQRNIIFYHYDIVFSYSQEPLKFLQWFFY